MASKLKCAKCKELEQQIARLEAVCLIKDQTALQLQGEILQGRAKLVEAGLREALDATPEQQLDWRSLTFTDPPKADEKE